MTTNIEKTIAIADRVVTLVHDGLAGLERTIGSWPAEFQVIIWEAVADTAARRAAEAKLRS